MNLPLADTDAAAVSAVELQASRLTRTESAASSTSWDDAATGRSPESVASQFADRTAKTPESGRSGLASAPSARQFWTFCPSLIDWAWTRPPASKPRSQQIDLGILIGRPVAMLDQPADVTEASHRPPRADEAQVDIGAVAGDDLAEVFRVSEREGGEVEQRVAPAALGPVDDAGHLVTGHKDVVDLQIAVNENRYPRAENGLSKSSVACDHVGVKNVMCDEPFALAVQARCKLVEVPTAPGWQWRVMQRPEGRTRGGPRCRGCG